jgi:hypothetical protein
MKYSFLFILSILTFNACKENYVSIGEPKQLENKLIVHFQLLDSTNISRTIFTKNEKMIARLTISNQLYQDLSFQYTGERFVFEIWHNDSLFAASTDFMIYEMAEYTDTIKSGKERLFEWFPPNTVGRFLSNNQ